MYRFILFDLDGTLTDPAEGITNSIMYGLRKKGITPPPREELYKYIGPPLIPAFMEDYHMSKEEAFTTLGYYREYFSTKGLFENEVYPGIPELLKKLKEKGFIVATATSKPEVFAKRIMEHFEIAEYFDLIGGSLLDETRTTKSEVIDYVLNTLGIDEKNKKDVVMIGDRSYDVIGAIDLGVDSIGVTYGYGSREELETSGATYIADTCDDIYDILMK